jgi:glycosyltransferase involved in cell wall biosynthesis
MKIGFEAKRAFTNGTGLGHYSRTLISSLAGYFPEHDYYLFTPKQTGLFEEVKQYKNVQIIEPSTFPSTILKSAWRSSWVKNDLKRLDIEVYHGLSHEIPAGLQATGIKSVVTIHDLIFERNPEQYNPIDVKIYRKKFKYACENADRVIAISQQTKDDIIQFYGTPESKIDICYQSCNPAFGIKVSEEEKKRIKNYYQLPDQFFLYVGSIIERKNLLNICKAVHLLKGKLNIPLVVIGNGNKYKNEIKRYISSYNIDNQIIFLSEKFDNSDFKSAKDFPAIYQQALAMIYPSTFEGFGIPVLEALWSNTPVITSSVSCMPETGGDAAFYVNPLNPEEISNAMLQIADNEQLRLSMTQKGWQHAQKFTQQNCAAAVMNVYRNL